MFNKSEPILTDPKVALMIRYVELSPRDQARATIRCLRRLGLNTAGMKARRLTWEEAGQLIDHDFREP